MENQENKPKHPILKKILIFIIGSFFLLFCYARIWSHHFLEIKEFPIINENLASNFNGFKIVHFSDIHFGRTTNEKELDKIVQKINLTNADVVVFTGDLFDNSITLSDKNIDDIKKSFSNIKASIKKIAIYGDQDYTNIERYQEIMNAAGFELLENNNTLIYKNGSEPFLIAGVSSITKEQDIQKSLMTNETNVNYKILLAHEPIVFDQINENEVDFILSGHSLGGLISLPKIGGMIKKENTGDYLSGLYEKEKVKMVVSSGIGTETMSYRFLNNPSINLYRFYNY